VDDGLNLGSQLEAFVEHLVEEGRYASRDEVLRESVRMLRERETRLVEFRASIEQGIADVAAGRGIDAEDVFAELDARYAAMEKAGPTK
jgi:antitoxin ParD1/3/4